MCRPCYFAPHSPLCSSTLHPAPSSVSRGMCTLRQRRSRALPRLQTRRLFRFRRGRRLRCVHTLHVPGLHLVPHFSRCLRGVQQLRHVSGTRQHHGIVPAVHCSWLHLLHLRRQQLQVMPAEQSVGFHDGRERESRSRARPAQLLHLAARPPTHPGCCSGCEEGKYWDGAQAACVQYPPGCADPTCLPVPAA